MSARLIAFFLITFSSTVTGGQLFPQAKQQPLREAPVPLPAFQVPSAAATEKRLAAALAWQNETLFVAYQRHGRHDARWDGEVKKGLGLIAQINANDPARPGDAGDQAWYWLTTAIALGCDDPLVKFEKARLSRPDRTRKDSAAAMHDAAIELERSAGYSLYRRGYGLINAASSLVNSGTGMSAKEFEPIWRESLTMLDRALGLWEQIAKDWTMPDEVAIAYVNEMCDTFVRASRKDRKVAFDPALAALKAGRRPNDAVVPLLSALFFQDYAWDARGTEFSDDVVASAWPLFYARLNESEKMIGEAIKLEPSHPAIPRLMMRVIGGTTGDVQEIDAWFRKGVVADPGDRVLYESMLNWLQPKWHGSVEEAAAFVEKAAVSGKWGPRVPFLVVDMHDAFSKMLPNAKSYYKVPEVCDSLSQVYTEFLKRYPDAGYDRGAYAKQLTWCGRWADAKKQIDLIAPDRLRVGAFGGQAAYENLLLSVAAHLK